MAKKTLLARVGYAFKMGWIYRKNLGRYLRNDDLQISSVTLLSLERLQAQSVQVLILDFDGVLGGDHALLPADFVKPWLDAMYQYYQERLFILSNKPLSQREAYFTAHYPLLKFIKGVAKKPYPEGLNLIAQQTGMDKEHILFCDDRLMTGILAAEIAGVKALWVTKPIKNFLGRFWHELFFTFLRLLDWIFLRALGG